MAFSIKVKTQLRDPDTGVWSDGNEVLFTKNGVSAAWETDGRGAIQLNSGEVRYINKSLDQIETFLNGA